MSIRNLRSFNLAGTEATRTYVDGLVGSFNNSLYAADVRLPGTVGFAVGVRNVVSEDDSFSAQAAFCHFNTSHCTKVQLIEKFDCFICPHLIAKKTAKNGASNHNADYYIISISKLQEGFAFFYKIFSVGNSCISKRFVIYYY